ncbi:AAA family ATPase [Mycobacterium riyadhense]|uniref:2-phosphoglycerate kinase n=1 Tax=Mycobacterium riyadhense TaxID=486698 RepID=A0A653EX20_9MYCO|nr:bifunctional aminoglycoside phosphotransferase/ATP-binding protein [Mycobacterium riyadhense]MCV7145102.1 AAA family ATPase [Mycobacterium riyadhense]VTP01879.1 2-phosphoglycerate kinase [Mycobacterium riyadhense]
MDDAIPTSTIAGASTPYVDVHETHTGVVVLFGERAYKAKKPVLTDFLDFRSAEQREAACLREVELNSRLSPGSYLGVAHLDDPAGGSPEPLVVMRRYRDSDRLAALVTRSEAGGADESVRGVLDTIAAVLARFHEHAERGQRIDAKGTPEAVNQRWSENLHELYRYAGDAFSEESIARIEHLATDFISGRAALFTRRIADGCIVDGHGDLLADDIFWVDGELAMLDCLEFDDELRYIDHIDDAAFLAMDLEFLGRQDLGDYFLDRYLAHSDDSSPMSLRDFYIAYRAVVRAKVDCVRLAQGKSEAAANASRHVAIATQHLEDGAVRLALIGGNPGTGKSTLARALAEQVGARVISTDDVRRELRERGDIAGDPGVLDAGLYSRENVTAVYEETVRRASLCLPNGQSVILDGTWRDPRLRALAHRLATETHSALVELMCTVAGDAAADRIKTRQPGNSDATPEIATALAARHTGWDTAHRLETTRPLEDSLREAREAWRRATQDEYDTSTRGIGHPGGAGLIDPMK